MPAFTYTGPDERYYPDLGVHAVPGETQTFDKRPDELWVGSASKSAGEAKAARPREHKTKATVTATDPAAGAEPVVAPAVNKPTSKA